MSGKGRDTLLVAGLHSARAALSHGSQNIVAAWVDTRRRDRRLKALVDQLRDLGIPFRSADRQTLDRLVPGANHQGIVVQTRAAASRNESGLWRLLDALEGSPRLLVLDGIKDPHNLGACLRTADAAGVQAVIAPRDRSVGLTPVAAKVASGAAEQVPFFQVTNLARVLKRLAQDYGLWIVGTAGEAPAPLFQARLAGPLALVMGSEGEGLRRLTREHCDQLVSIPMAGRVASLNVSVATGICLFEAVRQSAERHS